MTAQILKLMSHPKYPLTVFIWADDYEEITRKQDNIKAYQYLVKNVPVQLHYQVFTTAKLISDINERKKKQKTTKDS